MVQPIRLRCQNCGSQVTRQPGHETSEERALRRTLATLMRDHEETLANLEATQKRCTELIEEVRRLKETKKVA